MNPLGLYIHVPFCVRKCPYCGFFSESVSGQLTREYIDAVLKELVLDASSPEYDTVYIGGGTPSVLPYTELELLCSGLNNICDFSRLREWTLEVNPGTLDSDKADVLRDGGVDRFSFGFQSMNDEILKKLGRIHNSDDNITAFRLARSSGIGNISLDLIYGVPGQTLKELEADIESFLLLQPEHISCYELSLEPGTPFSNLYGDYDFEENLQVEMARLLRGKLTAAGYDNYEISSFCLPGYASKHNLKYWKCRETQAAGAGGVSFVDFLRVKRIENIREYIETVRNGRPAEEYRELISGKALKREILIMGLRLEEGVSESEFAELTGNSLKQYACQIRYLSDKQLVTYDENALKVTESGKLLLNEILLNLFE